MKGWLELRPQVWTDLIEDLKFIEENENYLKAIKAKQILNVLMIGLRN